MAHTIEPATTGRAKCRGCGEAIPAGMLRFGETVPNAFGEGEATHWFHLDCGAFRRPHPFLEAVESATDADWLGREAQRAYEQIREAVLADPVKQFTNEEFEAEAAVVIDLARRRPAFVLSEVQRLFGGR